MAVRVPVKLTPSNDVKDMNSGEIEELIIRCAHLYMANPSIVLGISANQSGSLTNGNSGIDIGNAGINNRNGLNIYMEDSRYRTGTAHTNVTTYPPESTTGEPDLVYADWQRISQNLQSVGSQPTAVECTWPLYRTTGNDLRAMSDTDVLETFINPAVDYVAGQSSIAGAPAAEDQPGTGYRVLTTTGISGDGNETALPTPPPGYSPVSGTVVGGFSNRMFYTNTFADQTRYTDGTASGAIGTAGTYQDYYEYVNYWLYVKASISTASFPSISALPLVATLSGDLQKMEEDSMALGPMGKRDLEFGNIMERMIRWAARLNNGNRLYYAMYNTFVPPPPYDGLGSVITNTRITTSGTKYNRFVNANDYRAQEFPIGSSSTLMSWALGVTSNY